jgi:sugar lactone lactonase YvrE
MRSLLFAGVLACVVLPAAVAQPVVIDAKAAFPEGPLFFDGKLYYAQYGAHKISVWDGETIADFWSQDGCGPAAIGLINKGFAITCYDSNQIVRVSRTGKTIASYNVDASNRPLVGPNDLTPDGNGGVYFTASGPWESAPIVGRVLHMSAEGVVRGLADDLHYANGIALSADGKTLYVAESEAGRIITFNVDENGALSNRRLFVRLTSLQEPVGAYPDGIKLDAGGRLYIGQFSAGRILVVNSAAELVGKIEVPSSAAPNLTFSTDGKTIFVVAIDDTNNAPYPGKVYELPNQPAAN